MNQEPYLIQQMERLSNVINDAVNACVRIINSLEESINKISLELYGTKPY